jgi:hypothetical protein
MKNNWIKVLAAVAATVCFTAGVQATSVSGSITFVGGVTLDTSSSGTATEVTGFTGAGGTGLPSVLTDSGSFATFVADGATVTFPATWTFASGDNTSFWTVGGFTFELFSSIISSQPGNSVSVTGSGQITGNGFTATAGTFNFSTQDPSSGTDSNGNAVFSFSASSGSVPDGGTTMMLLGGALMGLGLIKRKLSA